MNDVFVGREMEMSRLGQFLDQALAGQGQVAFITGEAGTGKTALVREFARRSQANYDDVLVALGEADAQTGIGDAYLPFREVLRLLTGDVDAQLAEGAISHENAVRLRDFVGVSAQVLLDLGPDLIEFFVPGVALAARVGSFVAGRTGLLDRLEKQVETAQTESLNGSNGVEQEHIFEQYTNVLERLAGHRPIVLILDDLQWADGASLNLLFRLGRRITSTGGVRDGDKRVLIIGTYRPNDVAVGRPSAQNGQARHPLLPVVNEFKRYSGDIEVQLDLARPEAANSSNGVSEQAFQFVSSYVDAVYAPHNLSEGKLRLIAKHTRGHPLFTVELLRSLEERGWLTQIPPDSLKPKQQAGDDGIWTCPYAIDLDLLPPRVEAVFAERIERLTDEQRRVLTVASVEGTEFTAQVVAQVEGLKDLELVRMLEEELQDRHRLVEELGVKRHNGQMLFLYQFRHSLLQQYLYERLGTGQRLLLHDAVGEALESLYGDDVHDMEVALAHHFLVAGNDEKALKYLLLAGDHAWSHHANHEALAHYDKALEAAGRLGEAADPEQVLELRMRRAQVLGWLGRIDEAISEHEQALGIAQDQHDATCQVQCLNRMAGLLAGPRGFKAGMSYAGRALQIASEADDKPAIIDSLNGLGNFQANLGELADAAASHAEALSLARELGDERRIADSLDGLRLAKFDSPAEEDALLNEIIDIRRRLDDQKGLLNPLAALAGNATIFKGRYDYAEDLLDEALEISQHIGERTTRPWLLSSLADTLWRSGDLGEAYVRAQEALDLAEEIGHAEWTASSHTSLGQVNLALYRFNQAQYHTAKGHDLANEIGAFLIHVVAGFVRGLVALMAGDAGEAIRWIEPAAAEVWAGDATVWVWLISPWLAAAYAEQGDVDRALELFDARASDPAMQELPELYLMSRYAYGRVLIAAGDIEGAESALAEALALAQQIGSPFWEIEVRRALARLCRDQGRSDDAERHSDRILELGEAVAGTIRDPEMRAEYLAAPPFAEAREATGR